MPEKETVFFALATISAAKFAALVLCRVKKLQQFEKVGTVQSILQYPLKSGGPICLDTAICTRTGLFYNDITDRHWMIIRKDGSFLSARLEPKLVLIKPSTVGDSLHLDAPGMSTLILPKHPRIDKDSRFIKCRVWDDYITGLHCGADADKWIRKFLNKDGISIVVSTAAMEKREACLADKLSGNPAIPGDITAFADFTAYLIFSETSLEDLNGRLERKATVSQFRPNITITGCKAYDEDNWSELRIGDRVYIRLLDLCTRCVATTINPLTGEKDPKRQPLETLRSYRYMKEYDAPCLGVNAAVDIEGEIKVGDPVYVIRKYI